jgi:lipoprotein-anchoring transpeptidase ErfK/SrfK
MKRRLLIVAAAAAAVATPFAVADGPSAKKAQAHRSAPAAAPAADASNAAAAVRAAAGNGSIPYAEAQRKGQPLAVLTRRTVLRAAPGGRALTKLPRKTEWGTPTVLAAVGKRGAWLRVMATQLPNGGRGWIPASAAGIAVSRWKLEADLSRRLVTVRRGDHAVRRFRVAVGRPSTPTPTGRFAITDKLHFTDHSRAYGWGAIALTGHQPHIEPGWTGGDRLAIHGTSDQASIGQAASFGCLRASDADVRWLVHHAYLGSIVEIRP